MASAIIEMNSATHNPIDIVEGMVTSRDWNFDRLNAEEMAVEVPGRWCDLSLYFSWNDEARAVHFSCALDLRVPEEKRRVVNDLLATINDRMWLGFFNVWDELGVPMYRHAIPLRGTFGASVEQMEDLIEVAVDECDRFYPAFQFVIWGGKSPREAMDAAMIDPMGEA
ncbi:MAG: YbjN domain-containing protein [Magnetospiraceae bacterium]